MHELERGGKRRHSSPTFTISRQCCRSRLHNSDQILRSATIPDVHQRQGQIRYCEGRTFHVNVQQNRVRERRVYLCESARMGHPASRSHTPLGRNWVEELAWLALSRSGRSFVRDAPLSPFGWFVNIQAHFTRVLHRRELLHLGFYRALFSPFEMKDYCVFGQVLNVLRHFPRHLDIFFSGHSQGGALAAQFAYCLFARDINASDLADRIQGFYTFGQPRAGDLKFSMALEKKFGYRYRRFVNGCDVIPSMPPPMLGFVHGGRECLISSTRMALIENQQLLVQQSFFEWVFCAMWKLFRGFFTHEGHLYLQYASCFSRSGPPKGRSEGTPLGPDAL